MEKLFNQESKLSDEDCRAWIIGKWKQKFSSGGGGTARDTDIITFEKDGNPFTAEVVGRGNAFDPLVASGFAGRVVFGV